MGARMRALDWSSRDLGIGAVAAIAASLRSCHSELRVSHARLLGPELYDAVQRRGRVSGPSGAAVRRGEAGCTLR
jgi:hypothetical protein